MDLLKRPLLIRWPLEIGFLVGGALAFVGGEYLRVRRSPKAPVEKKAQRMLNRLDRVARERLNLGSKRHFADRASYALALFGLPAACLLWLGVTEERPFRARSVLDAVRIAQAVVLVGGVNQIVKAIAPRERPFVQDCPDCEGMRDARGSFFSSHTSTATALAAATTRMALQRGASGWMGVPVYLMSLLVGYLRIASDSHFLTDVLAGAVFGTTVGALLART